MIASRFRMLSYLHWPRCCFGNATWEAHNQGAQTGSVWVWITGSARAVFACRFEHGSIHDAERNAISRYFSARCLLDHILLRQTPFLLSQQPLLAILVIL